MNESERLPYLLRQMRQAALEANEMVASHTFEEFRNDMVLQRAVGMTLLIVAETAMQVMAKAPHFVADHPEIPWSNMRGMRNRLAHGYLSMNLQVVYETAKSEVSDLVALLDTLLSPHAQGE
ncbi:HepT-like ribonuclease domain-containing protein [Rhizobium sp. RU36D]|uniref:HepT-like ribonuclease domain-containing protein n=1 Tax=Rhizobium sp. RU36D TaxID=1907415 RepID=UPI0009D81C70|nr:HepT-like ribonuclease domain-containing protein [Rhizobium sp. RU36D]SMD02981.1 Uncharacterized conserved protein, contains HEPN domain [Rhizobium sp. RU36D]